MPGTKQITASREATLAKANLAKLIRDMERSVGAGGPLSIPEYVAQIQEDITATKRLVTKQGVETIPDSVTREGAKGRWERLIERSLAYGIGLPVQRSEAIIHNTNGPEEWAQRAMASKESRKVLRAQLDEADRAAEAVDVESVENDNDSGE